jgi:hypothetical protein
LSFTFSRNPTNALINSTRMAWCEFLESSFPSLDREVSAWRQRAGDGYLIRN